MEGSEPVGDVLAEVRPRLKRHRAERDVTSPELSRATEISKSTLSRLESGQRKPSSELGPPIAQAHRIPPRAGQPEPRAHEGYEWPYVLSGSLPLIVAGHDIVMEPGEVAELDTRVPHRFGAAGDQPAEILSIPGREGERIHGRARPRSGLAGA